MIQTQTQNQENPHHVPTIKHNNGEPSNPYHLAEEDTPVLSLHTKAGKKNGQLTAHQ
jgi:hypothetical protein